MGLLKLLGKPELPRTPRFAGLFYPAERSELAALINAALVNDAPKNARAIVVPHSDLRLVGELIGAGFSRLVPARRVVILAPSHKIPFAGVAVPNADGWTTPIATSRIAVKAYPPLEPLGLVRVLDPVFDAEPAVELLVPWVQRTHPKAEILAMLSGDIRPDAVEQLLRALADEDTALVIACELGWDLGERELVRDDEETLGAIESLEEEALTTDRLTARSGVCGLVRLARRRDWRVERIVHKSSRELGAPGELTAGYASLAFVESRP